MNKIIYESECGSYQIDSINAAKYASDGSLAIDLWSNAEGPIARLTVCLCDKSLKENQAYVDTNNNPMAPMFIEKYGLGKPTGKMKASGFCVYPLYEFDVEKLKTICK